MGLRNFKLTIEYDGTDYSGWQVQPGRPTVQGEFYSALGKLSVGDVHIIGAGRTDAGVHASGQVASARFETKHAPNVLRRAVNARLPADIIVRSIEEVDLHFNARRDAKSRTYQYIFIRRPTALWRRYYRIVRGEMDLKAMRRELVEIRGERDFTSFASADDEYDDKRCRVIGAALIDIPPLLILEIEADHFLHHMVRTIAGTILEIGKGKPWRMGEIIEARDRSRAGPTLPPNALYLKGVSY
jgi:tRNA pseudouridine38-40 synthase